MKTKGISSLVMWKETKTTKCTDDKAVRMNSLGNLIRLKCARIMRKQKNPNQPKRVSLTTETETKKMFSTQKIALIFWLG